VIRPLDTSDDQLLARVHELLLACHLESLARVPYRDGEATAAYFRHPPSFERRLCWVAGDVDGFARLGIVDGSRSAWLELAVAASARRRGIGRALFETAVGEARRHGCVAIAGRHSTAEGAAFARAVGARGTLAEITSVLELATARLPSASVQGYRTASWIGVAPPEILESYAAARNAINDAPASNQEENYVWTAAMVRDEEAMLAERGSELRVTVAVDEDGAVAAFTELRVSPTPGTFASTEDTATVEPHRGRGLATWIKSESLQRLRAERPAVRLVTTTNAAENAAILAVNRRLGFEPAATATTASVPLATSA
jgi:GNAT superfamily N-acetyltransferase